MWEGVSSSCIMQCLLRCVDPHKRDFLACGAVHGLFQSVCLCCVVFMALHAHLWVLSNISVLAAFVSQAAFLNLPPLPYMRSSDVCFQQWWGATAAVI